MFVVCCLLFGVLLFVGCGVLIVSGRSSIVVCCIVVVVCYLLFVVCLGVGCLLIGGVGCRLLMLDGWFDVVRCLLFVVHGLVYSC